MGRRGGDTATRDRLLNAAQGLMLTSGYAGTSVGEICDMARLTKGAFFHYFDSKAAIGEAAIGSWAEAGARAFAAAPFMQEADPLARIHGYIDFTIAASQNPDHPVGCLIGAFAQEQAATNSAFRACCFRAFEDWAGGLRELLDEAAEHGASESVFDSASLARHFIAVFEGSLILAKVNGDRTIVRDGLEHFRAYLRCLLDGKG